MAGTKTVRNRKLLLKTIVFGALSLTMYTVFFMNSALATTYYTKGLYYAALPILTAFAFSFVHGAFAGNVWSLLGIEAAQKRPQPRPVAQPRPASTRRPRARVHMDT